jgi:hypothetical protein
MTTKANFTEQEWDLLQSALLDAGRYIALADPVSKSDLTKEARAMDDFFADVRDRASRLGLEDTLLQELVTDTFNGSSDVDAWLPAVGSPQMNDLKKFTLDDIRQAAAILDAKATPEEAKDIKIKMYQLAGTTAAAAKEGSFLGFGGKRVTDAERAALNEIAAALGVNPGDAATSWPLPGEE